MNRQWEEHYGQIRRDIFDRVVGIFRSKLATGEIATLDIVPGKVVATRTDGHEMSYELGAGSHIGRGEVRWAPPNRDHDPPYRLAIVPSIFHSGKYLMNQG